MLTCIGATPTFESVLTSPRSDAGYSDYGPAMRARDNSTFAHSATNRFFVIVGAANLCIAGLYFWLQNATARGASLPTDVLVVAVFGLSGVVLLALFRYGYFLEDDGQAIVSWRGPGFPLVRRRRLVRGPTRLVLRGALATFYSDGSKTCLPLGSSRHQARERAGALAEALGIDVHVVSALETDVVAGEYARLSLRDRLLHSGDYGKLLLPPPGCLRIHGTSAGNHMVSIPRRSCRPPSGLTTAVGLVAVLLAMVSFGLLPADDALRRLVSPATLPLYVAALFVVAWWPCFARTRAVFEVIASEAGLTVHSRGMRGSGTVRMDSDALRDVYAVEVCDGVRAVIAVSADSEVAFGAGLSDEEVVWLLAFIKRGLVACSPAA